MFAPPIIWKKSTRARRVILRVDIQQNALIVTIPPHITHQQAIAFVQTQSQWIHEAFNELPPSALKQGSIPIEGRSYPIHIEEQPSSRRIWLDGEGLHITKTSSDNCEKRLKIFLRHLAAERIPTFVEHHAKHMGITPTRLTLRDVKSRWGSCTRQGHVMLSWRLILAPPSVCHYVIVHELSHLLHFNHSANFWACVDKWYPEGRKGRLNAEKWLHHYGITLLRMI
ncbi:DUF45 domain-containing protein [Saccharibacter sp. 17.LH.SD]|uniref:M48 family metallopeptidase n=1 Tax=Saccharibacter sp. 17.LH.SD TaxID=2689393 RepID=UPI001371D20D|nr:SprT family zinc-dependent metalloprotease [Saccharibacter sp. 17.LH.SD]MXV43776.1 DUF45 domain-containing protein [Saccharibacter sp. 17.LH.SD]